MKRKEAILTLKFIRDTTENMDGITKQAIENSPELMRILEEEKPESVLSVEISYSEDDLTVEDLFPDDPATYLKNGSMAAIAEQIIDGISKEHGISIKEAMSNAAYKANAAKRVIELNQLKDLLGEAVLGMSKPAGEC